MPNANENQNKNLQLKNAIFSMTVCKINTMTSVIQDAQSKDKYICHAWEEFQQVAEINNTYLYH